MSLSNECTIKLHAILAFGGGLNEIPTTAVHGTRMMKLSARHKDAIGRLLTSSVAALAMLASSLVASGQSANPSDVTSDSITSEIAGPPITAPASTPPKDPQAAAKQAEAQKKQADELKKKVAGAYKDPFYLNDFTYLNDPKYRGNEIGENLKGISLGGLGSLDFGGQYRLRYHHEQNMRGAGLTGRDDDFLLDRTRFYFDHKLNHQIRLFAEFLDAGSTYKDFAPRGIEVNQLDAQNLFADALVTESAAGKLSARLGRQELLFGAQRLLSPLDWANTRRTFEGGRLTWANEDQTTDLLLVRPIRINVDRFDSPDQNQVLYGVYNSNKTFVNGPIDTYWLGYEDDLTSKRIHTVGTLLKGEAGNVLWDNEFGYQFGRNGDGSDASAYSLTFGLGQKIEHCTKPVLWFYYDWASGDDSVDNGWNHLFPLGHRYNGFMDLFGRRNLHDINTLLTFNPTQKLTVLAWYHYFVLANGNQGPYNLTLSPFNPGGTVGSRDLGHELDLLGTYKVNRRSDLVLGYSHFFAGNYFVLSQNAGGNPLFSGDADFFYTQWHYNF